MSCIVETSDLSFEFREKLSDELKVVPNENKYGKQDDILTFDIFDKDNKQQVTIPFSYFYQNFKEFPNDSVDFPRSSGYSFNGTLNDVQEEIKKETYDILNKTRSILISLYCGAGKCLHPETPVLLWNGDVKKSKDIVVGDVLIGDDSTPRNVLSTCSGREKMYRIKQKNGDDYIVNESHILSVKDIFSKFDLNVKTYLEKQCNFSGYKVGVNFPKNPHPAPNPYEFGKTITQEHQQYIADYIIKSSNDTRNGINSIITHEMQPRISKNYLVNDIETRVFVLAGILDIAGYILSYNDDDDDNYDDDLWCIRLYTLEFAQDVLYLIRSLGLKTNFKKSVNDTYCVNFFVTKPFYDHCGYYDQPTYIIPCRKHDIIYVGWSYDDLLCSKLTIEELEEGDYNGFVIDGNHRFLLGDFTVTHNTIYSIFLASKLQYKTMVLCHRVNLIDQWKYSIEKVCPDARVQIIEGKTQMNDYSDFYIMNVGNVTKKDRFLFKDIGLLIVDESHTICTENLSQSLFRFTPRYVIFLTATPDRTDGKGKILDLYVGKERITRKLWRPFNVYMIDTGYKIKTEKNSRGKLDWNSVLESQCNNDERNNFIVDIIRFFRNRNFLVLCKRVGQGKYLLEKLREYDEDVDMFAESDRKFNRESRILISTYSKTGVGFDHPKLDALIIASDVEEGIEQYVGRVFRREDVTPIVFDLVDKLHTLFMHYCTRRDLYISIGGDVKNFEISFPEFEEWREWKTDEVIIEI